MPTLSNIPPIRTHAVIVVVVVVVNVTRGRNAKKNTTYNLVYLFSFTRSPSNRHSLYIRYQPRPIPCRLAIHISQIHREFYKELQFITICNCICNSFASLVFMSFIVYAICFKECLENFKALYLHFIYQGMTDFFGKSVCICCQYVSMFCEFFCLSNYL